MVYLFPVLMMMVVDDDGWDIVGDGDSDSDGDGDGDSNHDDDTFDETGYNSDDALNSDAECDSDDEDDERVEIVPTAPPSSYCSADYKDVAFIPQQRSIRGCSSCDDTRALCNLRTNSALRTKKTTLSLNECQGKCERGCKLDCMSYCTLPVLKQMRTEFWGDCPTAKDRRAKIARALDEAKVQYNRRLALNLMPQNISKSFCFVVNNKVVCEKAFAFVIGMCDDHGKKLKTWTNEVLRASGWTHVLYI
jgi:hypothetical protein